MRRPAVVLLLIAALGGPPATPAEPAPTCPVSPDDPARQALEPSPAQVDWAIGLAVAGRLRAPFLTRPAGYLGSGLPAYEPSVDFPLPRLTGALPGTGVPAAIVRGVLAAESGWHQAARYARPGETGEPLLASYFGTDATRSTIDYPHADCRTGLGQIVPDLVLDQPSYQPPDPDRAAKVAIDYAENVAATVARLADTWNEVAAAGITANDGDPSHLENWYLPLWAYDTGLAPDDGAGHSGLGYGDNPARPAFRGRHPFGSDPADLDGPGGWPFQERALALAAAPPAGPALAGAIALPADTAFCGPANGCTPADGCVAGDGTCAWHGTAGWVADCAATCTVDTPPLPASGEPALEAPPTATCTIGLPPGTLVVDDAPPGAPAPRCPPSLPGASGTFAVAYGTSADGTPVGRIDWHPVGVGLGGRSHLLPTRSAATAAFIDTAAWTPPIRSRGLYLVAAFLPASRTGDGTPWQLPATTLARYRIAASAGPAASLVAVSQVTAVAGWVPLGAFLLGRGAHVTLDNATGELRRSVAFDAVAFTPACRVPALAGRNERTARRRLRASGCAAPRVVLVPSRTPRGQVVSSAPRAGTAWPSRRAVVLRVSRGRR